MIAIREIKVIGRRETYELSVYLDEEDYQTIRLWEYALNRVIGRNTTYVMAYKNGKKVYLHRLIMGLLDAPRSVFVDHIDHNGLNNCRNNLRITDNRGNNHNSRKRLSETSSRYKGVSWNWANNHTKPWKAHIRLSDKKKHLGYYQTEIEAAIAYNKAALELFGPYAYLNVIRPIKFSSQSS